MIPRVLFAGLFHETNTFADEGTALKDFRIRSGAELLSLRSDGSPLGAFVAFAEARGWALVPVVDYRALPGGTVRDEVIEAFWDDFKSSALPALAYGVDAIYLVLHGAMVSESFEDVEGLLLERIRAIPGAGTIPIFGVTDLHGNFTEKMARHANLLVAYRENPHTDAALAATRAAQLLERSLQTGQLPRTRLRPFPMVWPPSGTATAATPMRELEIAARELEAQGHWSVDVYGGFAHADIRDAGVSVAVSDCLPDDQTDAALDRLEELAVRHRDQGLPSEWDLGDALDAIAKSSLAGPAILVEPADNIGGGGPGDCTTILRELVRREVPSAGVILNDPSSVRALEGLEPGQTMMLALGGKGSWLDPGPFKLEVQLIRRTDGVFELEDRQSHLASMEGFRIGMGPCAVVRHGGVVILLTSRKTPPFDLGQWRSQGIEPGKLSIIGVKAAVAHRRAYDKITAASYTVQTPGPCSSNLQALPYRKIRRPIFPLDPI
jgi:microcystin degradation protein MlrC